MRFVKRVIVMKNINKANKEAIMTRTKLTIATLIFMLTVVSLSAAPTLVSECCQPKPVGGFEILEKNTFYPLLAQRDYLESDVVLNFQIDVNGNVSNIRVAQSGGTMFDKSAIDAVLATKWNPATQDGYAVAVTFEQSFEYRTR